MARGIDDEYTPHGARERRLARPRRASPKSGESTVPRVRAAKSETRKQIERGLNGDASGSALARAIAHAAAGCDRGQLAVARAMLNALERGNAAILHDADAAAGVVAIARHRYHFARPPEEFEPIGTDPRRQLRSLATHVFERWAVPAWLSEAFLRPDEPAWQEWFIHLGAGRNLSAAPALPYPLTKRMAHFATLAPTRLAAYQALRWGQLRGLDVPEELCGEIVDTRLGATLPDEPFWRSVVVWFAAHPEVFGHATTIVDYLFAQRIGDFAEPASPEFSMRGRTPDRLLRDATQWHRQFGRRRRRNGRPRPPMQWQSCGIAGFAPTPPPEVQAHEPAPRPAWMIMELRTEAELEDEGERLHHCVSSYAPLAAARQAAIFSLRRLIRGGYEPSTTIELRPSERTIVQARSLQNAEPSQADRSLIEAWARSLRLAISPSAMPPRGR